MEIGSKVAERAYAKAAGLALMGSLALTGCSQLNGTEVSQPDNPISQAFNQAMADMDCITRNVATEDCDRDGVANAMDVVPWRNDNGDDDGDGVLNNRDKWPGLDDKVQDMDNDGTPDYLDTFFGPNFRDADGDGLLNVVDPQPYIAPVNGNTVLPPQNVSEKQLVNDMLDMQMRNKLGQQLYGPQDDRDYDGIPDNIDSNPTEFTNDRDGDGDPDFYDPEPGDYYTNSKNDPYDPRNDEYWEDDY